jgi:5-methylcytosine-specific restriction endonuclease McrA
MKSNIPDFKICSSCKLNKSKVEYHTRICINNGIKYRYLKSKCKKCSHIESLIQLYDVCSCGNKKTKKSKTCRQCTKKELKYLKQASLKLRVMADNLIPYKCAICGNEGLHLDKPLSLQLDHINGNSKDNRLDNLRFLCPNCHSQTDTFCGKKNKLR